MQILFKVEYHLWMKNWKIWSILIPTRRIQEDEGPAKLRESKDSVPDQSHEPKRHNTLSNLDYLNSIVTTLKLKTTSKRNLHRGDSYTEAFSSKKKSFLTSFNSIDMDLFKILLWFFLIVWT